MAQLVKLYDYISRYESNPFHYPTQFIRLKQENWQQFHQSWLDEKETVHQNDEVENTNTNKRRFSDFALFSKKTADDHVEREISKKDLPKTKEQLIQLFLNQLLPFQYKWATSTISHQSYTDQKHVNDDILTYFLQRFPDIYLLLYYPLFSVKKAPIDGEIILISPVGIEIIHVIKKITDATIIIHQGRSWEIESHGHSRSIISPIFALKRTEQIVASILKTHQIDFPIQKTVLSETNEFLYHMEPYETNIDGRRNYEKWFTDKRSLQSPLKNIQLKSMEAILHHCHSTSVRRHEWEERDDSYMTLDRFKEI